MKAEAEINTNYEAAHDVRSMAIPDTYTNLGIEAADIQQFEESEALLTRLRDVDRKIIEYTDFLYMDPSVFGAFISQFNYLDVTYQSNYVKIFECLSSMWVSDLPFPIFAVAGNHTPHDIARFYYRTFCFRLAISNYQVKKIADWDCSKLMAAIRSIPTLIGAYFKHLVHLNLSEFSSFLTNAQGILADGMTMKNTLMAQQVHREMPLLNHSEQEQANMSGRPVIYKDVRQRAPHLNKFYAEQDTHLLKSVIAGKQLPSIHVAQQLTQGHPYRPTYMDPVAQSIYAGLSEQVQQQDLFFNPNLSSLKVFNYDHSEAFSLDRRVHHTANQVL